MNGQLVTVWSPGRSGATTAAAAAAVVLAGGQPGRPRWWRRPRNVRPLRVRVADFNRISPSLGQQLGVFPPGQPDAHCLSRLLPVLASGRSSPQSVAAALLPVGRLPHLQLLAGCYDLWAANRIREGQAEALLRLLAADCDLVLVDAGPQLDCPLTYTALEQAALIILVVGQTAPERLHARRYLLALRELRWTARVAVVLNRTQGGCPARLPNLLNVAGAGQVAEELGMRVAATLPPYAGLAALLEEGAIPALAARGKAGQAFRTAAGELGDLVRSRLRL